MLPSLSLRQNYMFPFKRRDNEKALTQ